jgi:5-oxopent-3-ene-1,2,5-tricarboxylate decarboxylase / 2-hydroxyhepta-2,4-diene-1,7-dioate isomerase
MKHARVMYHGSSVSAVESDGALLLASGERVAFEAVTWLPPLQDVPRPRTILALGLNYADHAKELAFKAPDEPLAFVKGQSSLIGHRAHTIRPAGVQFMHYECELAVVIGRTAKHVKKADAYDFIAGYTVANDYAIRDYLENWYRPNLRVKGRPTCTPIGPWLVDAADIADPMQYFSSFMTLQPGDLILTGTPDGVVDCRVGDVIVTSIKGIGALENTICAPAALLGSEPNFAEHFESPKRASS